MTEHAQCTDEVFYAALDLYATGQNAGSTKWILIYSVMRLYSPVCINRCCFETIKLIGAQFHMIPHRCDSACAQTDCWVEQTISYIHHTDKASHLCGSIDVVWDYQADWRIRCIAHIYVPSHQFVSSFVCSGGCPVIVGSSLPLLDRWKMNQAFCWKAPFERSRQNMKKT